MNHRFGNAERNRRDLLRDSLPVIGVGLAATALGVRSPPVRQGSAPDRRVVDDEVSALVQHPETKTAQQLSAQFARSSQVNVLDCGAVPDYGLESVEVPTDNLAAFQEALSQVAPGGRVFVPPGRYFLSDTLVITKAIDFDCGRGGFESRASGTQLVWPKNTTGIHVTSVDGVRPSDYRIGPFELTSLSEKAQPQGEPGGYGIYCTDGFGFIDAVSLSGFGSHGIYLRAGNSLGGGNVNNTDLYRVRCYGNFGDGIKCHGSDAQQIRIWGADLVANFGWGINMDGASANRVYAPHLDQQYHRSPGAIRDSGNSNVYQDVYTEHGDGQGDRILLTTASAFASITTSQYARPVVEDQSAGKTAVVFDTERGFSRSLNITGDNETRATIEVDVVSKGVLGVIVGGKRVMDFDSQAEICRVPLSLIPSDHNATDLGSKEKRFRSGHFGSFVRVGVVGREARPSASEAGAGAHMFDSNLGRPIWSNGDTWVDASGSKV